jgi:serine/threonine protein kinase
MLTSLPPFFESNRNNIINRILNDKHIKYPKYISHDAKDLLRKLLKKDPTKRLGANYRDIQVIKDHPFFQCIDWEMVEKKQLVPPYTPLLDHKADLKHFDPYIFNVDIESPTGFMGFDNGGQHQQIDQEMFKKFSFVATSLYS